MEVFFFLNIREFPCNTERTSEPKTGQNSVKIVVKQMSSSAGLRPARRPLSRKQTGSEPLVFRRRLSTIDTSRRKFTIAAQRDA